MGTHPIFESDFDCLTDMSFGKNGTSKSVGIKMSTWTPQSNGEAKEQMFHERRDLVTKWWSKWNGQQRAEVMGNLLGVCTNKQIRLLQDKLDERFPSERIDFSRQLPRKLSLHILKFLDPRSLSRCAQVSWYWKFLSESDELWRPKCLRFGWYPPYKPSQFEHGAWKHFYILKVTEQAVKPVPREIIPDPVKSARETKKPKKQKPPAKVWEPPPWRSNAPRPTEIHRNNVLDNSNFKKTSPQKTKKSVTISRPNTAAGSRSQYTGTRPHSAAPRYRSQSRSIQVKPPTDAAAYEMNSATINQFAMALNSSRSIRDAPLTPHQLSLTNQIKSGMGAPGYGNKSMPTLDFSTLNMGASTDFEMANDVKSLQGNTWEHAS